LRRTRPGTILHVLIPMKKKMRAYSSFDAYLEAQTSPNQAIIRALRAFVQRTAPKLTESVKWGNGCWLGPGGRPMAYVYSDTGYVQFGFFNGAFLKDPNGLLEGNGQYVRHTKVRMPAAIDERALAALLRQAVRV